MKLDNINKWLTLSANLGVLIGLIFLIVEINQSNRIAERDGRSELVSQETELQQAFLESTDLPQLMLKLSDPDAELTPIEEFGAESFASLLLTRAANMNVSYESDLLSGRPLERQVLSITNNIERMPGIAKYLARILPPRGNSPVFDLLWNTIDNLD